MDLNRLIEELTVAEKAALVSGTNFMYTTPIPRLNIPSLCMSDGPHGLRRQSEGGDNGIGTSEPATAFPTAATIACGWNPENAKKMGKALAGECRSSGVHILLGPGVNIKRNPLCGRNFEYYSEDPYLSGVMGAAMVDGVQSGGVGVSLKHFALNNSENYRMMGNSVCSEKAMRQIYLKPFEYVVKKSKPATVMCAYNQVNGTFCSENGWLLTGVLRNEWGFDGLVMSDWGAMHDRVASLKAGLDLEMPGNTAICRKWILDGIKNGTLDRKDLDKAVLNVLKLVESYYKPADPSPVDYEAHHALAAEIAADCAVLLKNDGALPLEKAEKLHLCGELFETMRYQGAGSSMVNPVKLSTPKDVFSAHDIKSVPISECDKIVAFIGLTDLSEGEGGDRDDMRLPESHLQLINEMCQTGKPVVVVLFGGAPVELPFADRVNSILNLYLPGQNGGKAVYDLLFGLKNPCGKLAETWPFCYEDVPFHESFGKRVNEVYAEGCEVGYRYYRKHQIPVRYPFGYGLSYTTFSHSAWKQTDGVYEQTVTNTGDRYGGEVAQLWIDDELRGFEKVYLQPGESALVRIIPEKADSKDYPDKLVIPPEPLRFPVTTESRFTDLRQTFFGRILFRAVMHIAKKQKKKALKLPPGAIRDNQLKGAHFLKKMLESNSLRGMSMAAGKLFPYNFAIGFRELANRHLFRGVKAFLTPVKAPKPPKKKK